MEWVVVGSSVPGQTTRTDNSIGEAHKTPAGESSRERVGRPTRRRRADDFQTRRVPSATLPP